MVQQEIDGCAQVTNSCKCLCVVTWADLAAKVGRRRKAACRRW